MHAFGWWDRGPFITRQIEAFIILLLYIVLWISSNLGRKNVENLIQSFIEKFKQLIYNSIKSPYKIAIILIMIFLLSIPARWLFFYYVPKYSSEELEKISIESWDGLSKVEKFRIGQSFYIRWKGYSNDLYKSEEYVFLIDEYIERTANKKNSTRYKSINSIVFHLISGV
jgi:hypothetical protein